MLIEQLQQWRSSNLCLTLWRPMIRAAKYPSVFKISEKPYIWDTLRHYAKQAPKLGK